MEQRPFKELFEENVDCDTPKKKEEEVKPLSLIDETFVELPVMEEDKENLTRALAMMTIEDNNVSGSDLSVESLTATCCTMPIEISKPPEEILSPQKQEMGEAVTQIPMQTQTSEEMDAIMAIVTKEDLQLPAAPRLRHSLLFGLDPYYLSSPRKEKLPEEQPLFSVIPPQDLHLAPIAELSPSAYSSDATYTPNASYLVGDQSDVTLTGGNLSQCSHPEIAKGDDKQEPPVEQVPADLENITKVAKELVTDLVECAVHTVENSVFQEHCIIISAKIMAEVTDKLAVQEEENAELKLQLNASQQVRATLELQLRQKEEVIIKSQTEALRKDQAFKLEIKQLKEKLEEKCLENDNSQAKDFQELIKSLKAREAKLLNEVCVRKNDELNYRKIMDEYEKTIAAQLSELQKLKEEHETVQRHLANLELGFSDVHQKYERSKKIIDGFKCNEDALRQTLVSSEDTVIKSEEKYESLKAHAKAQIEKSNQEMQVMRDQYDSEIHKLSAIIRRLEIKNASLTDSLDQKTKECSALAALCDEVTGKV